MELRRVLIGKGVNLTEERPIEVHFWAGTHSAVLAREPDRRRLRSPPTILLETLDPQH